MCRIVVKLAITLYLLSAGSLVFGQVKVWEEKLTMPTWQIGPPEKHPVFSDGGRDIYPYFLQETLTNKKADKAYTAVYLENEYIKVLVLPEIGGKLHGALDKTNGFEFFYWHKTIKPGLVATTGAWISGGIEWNYPHGHRPSCFMPVDHRIVKNADGSATVWVGETEPIFRMRWLVGMTVFPGRSYIRADYVFINPTAHKHSFQFWATAATYAGDSVQAQYPGDMVTGHGKHEFWNWPIHKGVDLTWWKNVANASSFFAFNNPSEWFGTYDHQKEAGMVHVGNSHIVLGKKLWTWGAGPSGRIWEDILSDGAGPYFEPQAGVWSDNQPDYHWMAPYEVKTAHDYWYPVRGIRGYHNANEDFAVNTDLRDGKAFGGVDATGIFKGCKVVLRDVKTGKTLSEAVATISPDKPYSVEVPVGSGTSIYDLHLAVYNPNGKLAIELQQKPPQQVDLPPGQKDPGDPKKLTLDELYHAGEWLDRFRRTNEALVYYHEALSRDPKDSRVNAELGFLALKQGKWNEALKYLDTALGRDGDNARLYYGKGLALAGLRKFKDAYDQFYRAIYGYEYFVPAYVNLAKIDMLNGDFREALTKLSEAQRQNRKFADIPALKAVAYRHLGDRKNALAAAEIALELDAMNFMGGYEKLLSMATGSTASAPWSATWAGYMRDSAQNYLELAASYAGAGQFADADNVLARYAQGKSDARVNPLVNYFRGYFEELIGDKVAAGHFYARARAGSPLNIAPHRLEEKAALEAAILADPADANAHLFLGNLLYGSGQREEGFAQWRKAAELDAHSVFAWRNVAYGEWHLKNDLKASYETYRKAFGIDTSDGRVLRELGDVARQIGVPVSEQYALLAANSRTVDSRDDLISAKVDLQLAQGGFANLKAAYDVLKNYHFHSWEGKYGIHTAWVQANKKLGDLAFGQKDYQTALAHYQQAGEYPKNLEVAARTPDFQAHVNWDLARVYQATGKQDLAQACLKKILAEKYGRVHLGTYYQALAQKTLGNKDEYESLLRSLEVEARERVSGKFEHRGNPRIIGYYLLSLVLEEKGDSTGAAAANKTAMEADPMAARLALHEAQIKYAGAHQ